ncbi:hypothetical protein EXE51_08470 [Halorubrum sp. CGM5_25_10-8B]|uniref:hypothetical protein n=1 Tax=Halorubrum sp. CGM5_25_10-8B TaxID=2518115 RepID=UPI0010F5FB06|nr:hypothetical protein [Halorubrum sp. CGM5_25_10-8B]TKX37093.1 hypothetical protein EXE51_08470 [Halorubrum sp. CGM5_25_10-8B]
MDTEPATASRTTIDYQPTLPAPTPDADSVDASIARTRRVQHLSAVVRARLDAADRHTDDPEALAKVVIEALYREHPHIRLEDALELARIVERPPEDVSTKRAIEHVVDDACSYLESWGRFGPVNANSPGEHKRAQV